MKKLVIIGGGAAGLMAALEAVRTYKARGVAGDIVILESSDRTGRSILATGNGRCNFSNAVIDPTLYRNASFVGHALQSAPGNNGKHTSENGVLAAFSRLGLVWREESEGRLYPLANKASSVVDVLHAAVLDAGVREVCGRCVARISEPKGKTKQFRIQCDDGSTEWADAVILAAGGKSARTIALPSRLDRVRERPVLGPLRTDVAAIKSLNNIRVRCAVSLVDRAGKLKGHEEGEILFREYGVSGIAIFNLSRFACAEDKLLIDFLPSASDKQIAGMMNARFGDLQSEFSCVNAEVFLRGMVLPAVANVLLKEAHLRPSSSLDQAGLERLAKVLKGFSLTVKGIGDARQCQVTSGGLAVSSFDSSTLMACEIAGCYAAGEALDVDAPCGGYNLHWAWASGMLAGRSAATYLSSDDSFGERPAHA